MFESFSSIIELSLFASIVYFNFQYSLNPHFWWYSQLTFWTLANSDNISKSSIPNKSYKKHQVVPAFEHFCGKIISEKSIDWDLNLGDTYYGNFQGVILSMT